MQRDHEVELTGHLEHIRQALILDTIASDSSMSSLYQKIWTIPDDRDDLRHQAFNNYLDALVASGYLAMIHSDPLVPAIRWGTQQGQRFWYPTRNLVASSSFETSHLTLTAWNSNGLTTTIATVTSNYWSGKTALANESEGTINRFGTIFGQDGHALVILSK